MKINSIKNTPNLYFKGCYGSVYQSDRGVNKTNLCTIETHFARDLESAEAAKMTLIKNFPNGTHIADMGCSLGYETYTLATLFNDVNQNKKYKITGYDIAPTLVENAKIGVLNIGGDGNNHERFLNNTYKDALTPLQNSFKTKFDECFEVIPELLKKMDVDALKNLSNPKSINELRVKNFLHPPFAKETGGSYYVPKDNIFEGIIDFKVADINNITKELEPQKTGMVVFKNALYHILNSKNSFSYNRVDTKSAEYILEQIYKVLPEKGLLFFGSLEHDHLYDMDDMRNKYELKYQNGKQIKVYQSSKIHEKLNSLGFKPIFYDFYKDAEYLETPKCLLPSVWEKMPKSILHNFRL